MAKHLAFARPRAPVIVMQAPKRRSVARRVGSRVAHAARRARPHLRKAAPVMGVALGGAVLGFAKSKGYVDKLPEIMGSKMVTLGLVGWGGLRFFKSPDMRAGCLAAIGIAAFDWGAAQGGGTSGWDDDQPEPFAT